MNYKQKDIWTSLSTVENDEVYRMMDYKRWMWGMMGKWLPRGFCQPVRSIKRVRHNTKFIKCC